MMKKSLRFLLGFLTCMLIAVAACPHAEAGSGVTLSAYTATPPTLDGNIQAAEWAAAASKTFGPFGPGMAYSGTLYMMNDGTNLYIGVSIEGDATFSAGDGFSVYFDNDHGAEATWELGDDYVGAWGASSFGDLFFDGGSFVSDVPGGTIDGQAAGSRQGSSNQFELSHPLNDADDAHDISLSLGQTVGFSFMPQVDGTSYSVIPDFGNVAIPSTYANYVVASPPPTPTPTPVGGVLVPVNKLVLLSPYLALLGLVGAVTVAVVVQRRRKN